ncbi:MAG: VOC family protein [Pirellulales bacterium]
MQINPYLMFNGQCEEAFRFYEKVLRGKIEAMIPHAGTPAEGHVPPEWHEKIMHARLVVGEGVLMASDAPTGRQDKLQGFSVSLQIPDTAEAERVFHALAEGGSTTMSMQETFWALRFGMCVDSLRHSVDGELREGSVIVTIDQLLESATARARTSLIMVTAAFASCRFKLKSYCAGATTCPAASLQGYSQFDGVVPPLST